MQKITAGTYFVLALVGLLMLIFVALTFKVEKYTKEYDLISTKYSGLEVEKYGEDDIALVGKLPYYSLNGNDLGFFVVHQNVQVYVDNKLVYSYIVGDNLFGSTPGLAWLIIPLSDDYAGKSIGIYIVSPYKASSSRVPIVYLGDAASIQNQIFKESGPEFIISCVILALGIVLLAYRFYVTKKAKIKDGILWLGIFAVILGVWSINETQLFLLIINNAIVSAYLSFISLMLMPVPFIMFIKELYEDNSNKLWYFCSAFSFVDLVVCILLQVFNVADFRQTVFLAHLVFGFCALVIAYMTTKELLKNHSLTNKIRINIICIFICIIGIIADIVKYYFIGGDAGTFGRISFLLFISIIGYNETRASAKLIKKGKESEMYQIMAYTDQMTGLSNRTALMSDIAGLYKEIEKNNDYCF